MNYYNFKKILNGNFDNIPVDKSKTVRIFLSSTFSGNRLDLIQKYDVIISESLMLILNLRYAHRTRLPHWTCLSKVENLLQENIWSRFPGTPSGFDWNELKINKLIIVLIHLEWVDIGYEMGHFVRDHKQPYDDDYLSKWDQDVSKILSWT